MRSAGRCPGRRPVYRALDCATARTAVASAGTNHSGRGPVQEAASEGASQPPLPEDRYTGRYVRPAPVSIRAAWKAAPSELDGPGHHRPCSLNPLAELFAGRLWVHGRWSANSASVTNTGVSGLAAQQPLRNRSAYQARGGVRLAACGLLRAHPASVPATSRSRQLAGMAWNWKARQGQVAGLFPVDEQTPEPSSAGHDRLEPPGENTAIRLRFQCLVVSDFGRRIRSILTRRPQSC